ncbi:site-2 protease family protein [Mucisphaera sp.]|uniref:site-2 protease family protein n=1 Tax=Mucisphaera sp. TaxID=2913024 RepID=UPI003D0EB128
MGQGLFFTQLLDPTTQFYALSWILVVIISITIHELAHGFAAVYLGDDTPIHLNRLTGNPIVHMGPFSLIALLIAGIAWGQMPVDHTRLKGRHAGALVAAAGPASNILLAILALTTLGLLLRFDLLPPEATWATNANTFLWVAGAANLILAFFNLLPVPPLDGSHIFANYNRQFADFITDPAKQGVHILMFVFAFITIPLVAPQIINLALIYLSIITG